MNRRDFLSATASALTLIAAPTLRADILKGRDATMHGQRDRSVWLAANRLAGVSLAKAGAQTQVVFFVDLNCPACAELWRWFDAPGRRKWTTRWVPVAYMNATSRDRAIALLRAADPYAALAQNYGTGFDFDSRIGALPVAASPSLAEQSRLRANTRFWNGALFGTTPVTLYRNRDGKYWQLLGLLPEPEMSGYFSMLAPADLGRYSPG